MTYDPNGREPFRRFRVAGPALARIAASVEGATLSPLAYSCPYCEYSHQRVSLGHHVAAYGCPNGCDIAVRVSLAHLVSDAEEVPYGEGP